MSGLKTRINKLIDRNYVYFSQTELAFTVDYFEAYLADENTAGTDYSKECKELDACAKKYINDKSCDYPAKLNEVAKKDFLAYHAYMCFALARLCEHCPEGIWLSDLKVIDVFLTRMKNAKRYFETRVTKV
jgi:hypothetical protein